MFGQIQVSGSWGPFLVSNTKGIKKSGLQCVVRQTQWVTWIQTCLDLSMNMSWEKAEHREFSAVISNKIWPFALTKCSYTALYQVSLVYVFHILTLKIRHWGKTAPGKKHVSTHCMCLALTLINVWSRDRSTQTD